MTKDYEDKATRWLKNLELKCRWCKRPVSTGFTCMIIVLVGLVYLHPYKLMSVKDAITVVLAITSAIIAYKQWVSVRYENSINKFYDRLDESNKRLNQPAARDLLLTGPEKQDLDAIMYIYGELDNLDYVVQKYTNGLMSPEQAKRGIETFKSRLRQKKFRQKMCNFCIRNPGYCELLHDLIYQLKVQIRNEHTNKVAAETSPSRDFFCCGPHCQVAFDEIIKKNCPLFESHRTVAPRKPSNNFRD